MPRRYRWGIVAVDKGGLGVFGSVTCEQACSSDGADGSIDLPAIGGFGSVEIVTESEYDTRRGHDGQAPSSLRWAR